MEPWLLAISTIIRIPVHSGFVHSAHWSQGAPTSSGRWIRIATGSSPCSNSRSWSGSVRDSVPVSSRIGAGPGMEEEGELGCIQCGDVAMRYSA